MFLEKLNSAIHQNNSLLCVGLDFDVEKTDSAYKDDPFAYNKLIIDSTKEFVCAYKPNSAFYEALGIKGLEALKKTIEYIPESIPVILDAKRGDIGNTSRMYAKAAFEYFKADAITVAPYMGADSVLPFLEYKDKGVFVLCLTSNKSSADFQRKETNSSTIFMEVAEKCTEWENSQSGNIGLVVGATQNEISEIRSISNLPFLIPGIGAQGGDLQKAVLDGNKNGTVAIINSSRAIIYPENRTGNIGADIKLAAKTLKDDINKIRKMEG